jgi:hypothetical protein
MSATALVLFFQVVTILGSALTAFKLYSTGLSRRYRIFFAYLVFRVPYMTCAVLLDPKVRTGWRADAYLKFFIYSEPLVMLFYVLVVFELYRLVLERYKGLYTLGRWAMYAAMSVAAGLSLVSFLRLAPSKPQPSSWMLFEVKAEARLDLALALFILLIVWFLSRYPIQLNRNVLVHTGVYSVFFLSNTLVLLLWLFQINVIETVNKFLTGITSLCGVAWWLLLSAKGEEVQVHAPALAPGSEQRILQQLDAINATLLKVSRN